MRIAMWSGPRNLSTTMMRAFGARADTAAIDEPFYAAYLDITGLRHPMTDEILARHEADPRKVITHLTGPVPEGKTVFYQKHMTHHMVDAIPMDWLGQIERHVVLIRHPARVVASYSRKMELLSAEVIQLGGRKCVLLNSRDITDPASTYTVRVEGTRLLKLTEPSP